MTSKWSVPREWAGETVAILASGPSMNRETADAVRGKCRVIAVNNQGIDTLDSQTKQMVPALAPWADVLFAADAKWWHAYQDRALKFAGRKVCTKPNLPWKDVYYLQQSRKGPFDPDPRFVFSGGNSGYMALHLAVHFGAKRVLLCGYDMCDGPGKKRHWFGNHPPRLNARNAYATWKSAFAKLAPVLQKMGVEVLNCTPRTALTCFKRVSLQEALSAASRTIAA